MEICVQGVLGIMGDSDVIQLGRPVMMAVTLSSCILDNLPKDWFIYCFIGIGVILFVTSCFGCVGAVTRNGCCLFCYAVLVILLILIELGCAAFIFFDNSWEEEIPTNKTGDFDMIYDFLKENWKIVKWVVLVAIILEALLFVFALMVRAENKPDDYDSDDEFIAQRQSVRQPLINRPSVPATSVPVAGTLVQRLSKNNDWSTCMQEKYGLDTSEFTYNPSELNRYPPGQSQPTETFANLADWNQLLPLSGCT